jgi:hypothetical protein
MLQPFTLSGESKVVPKTKTKLHGLGQRDTDRATAACRLSHCQLFGDRGCHMVSVMDPCSRILGFLDRSCYFSIK